MVDLENFANDKKELETFRQISGMPRYKTGIEFFIETYSINNFKIETIKRSNQKNISTLGRKNHDYLNILEAELMLTLKPKDISKP